MRTEETEQERHALMCWTSCLVVYNHLCQKQPAKLSKSSRILPNLKGRKHRGRGETVRVFVGTEVRGARVCVPDSVVEGQVFLSELWLGAQRQVDLQVAVLHPLGWKIILRLGQHGGQWHALRHGLPMVAADETHLQITHCQTLKMKSLNTLFHGFFQRLMFVSTSIRFIRSSEWTNDRFVNKLWFFYKVNST